MSENSIAKKVSNASTDSDDAFFNNVDSAIGGLAADFLAWVKEDLEGGLAAFGADGGDIADPMALARKIFTIMHDLKGQAGTFGYFLLAEIASSACEYIRDVVEPPTPGQMGVLRLHLMVSLFVVDKDVKGNDPQILDQFCVKRDAMIGQVGRPKLAADG